MRVFTRFITTTVALGLLLLPSSAKAATFTIDWTGAGGYTMAGEFSFDDALLGTGAITGADLASFSIEGFLNGVSVGTYDMADGLVAPDQFNFNFDTTTMQFLVGGLASSSTGQAWGTGFVGDCVTTGFGFFSGSLSQGLCVQNTDVGHILTAGGTLTATQVAVPEPASLALLGMGAVALGGRASRRRRSR